MTEPVTGSVAAAPSAIVLRPTRADFINDDPVLGPLDGPTAHRDRVMDAATWFADRPDRVVRAAAEYMLDLLYRSATDDGGAGQRLSQARREAGGGDVFNLGPSHFNALTRVGVDPTVLLALRGTSLTHPERLLVASVGLSPAEVHTMYADGSLDLDSVRAMSALRRRH